MNPESSFSEKIIMDMQNGKSLLMTFGEPGRALKRKMMITGIICRFILFSVFNPVFLLRVRFSPELWQKRKIKAIRFIRRFFPFDVIGKKVIPSKHGQIVVINHPTLNDPICGMLYALDIYPEREVVVPMNLPWFESVSKYRQKMLKIGINFVPILTPETAKRLGTDKYVSQVQSVLISNYTNEFAKAMANGGLAVVAQQATRRRYIFKDKVQSESGEGILSTISLVLAGLRRVGLLEQACLIPVGVIPPNFQTKSKLNPFKKYTLNVGEPIFASDLAAVKNPAKRPADLYILQQLMELVPEEYHFEFT